MDILEIKVRLRSGLRPSGRDFVVELLIESEKGRASKEFELHEPSMWPHSPPVWSAKNFLSKMLKAEPFSLKPKWNQSKPLYTIVSFSHSILGERKVPPFYTKLREELQIAFEVLKKEDSIEVV
ncbi:hypothetical protein CL619_00515 [archaeon]|nr:hypothetical protein [archaeon]|tara:strand:+ start:3918 stop:4289 length:372 start_codon:yes stop_codon:yes gene_type:complete